MIVNHDPRTKMPLDHSVSKNKFAETKCSSKRRVCWKAWNSAAYILPDRRNKGETTTHSCSWDWRLSRRNKTKQNKTYKINQNEIKWIFRGEVPHLCDHGASTSGVSYRRGMPELRARICTPGMLAALNALLPSLSQLVLLDIYKVSKHLSCKSMKWSCLEVSIFPLHFAGGSSSR